LQLIKFSTGNLPSSALTPIFEEVLFVPRRCLQKIKAILYLARLHTDNLNPLLKEAFELSKSLDSQGVSNNHEAYTNKNNT
jgi:hypothetical protein